MVNCENKVEACTNSMQTRENKDYRYTLDVVQLRKNKEEITQ